MRELKHTWTRVEVATARALLVAMVMWNAPMSAVPPSPSRSPADDGFGREGTVKVRVAHGAGAVALAEEAGGRLVAQYGDFSVYELSTAAATVVTAAARESAEVLEEANRIFLNSGTVDTTSRAVRDRRGALSVSEGVGLHLVQFAGPIKPEWREALAATGARIVSYIPSNSYLVYGDGGQLASVRAFAARSEAVQWDGAFTGEMKVHQRLGVRAKASAMTALADGGSRVIVQLVEDPATNPATLQVIGARKLGGELRTWSFLGYVNVITDLAPDSYKEIASRPDVVSIQPYSTPHKMDERQDQIMAGTLTGNVPTGPGYLAWLTSQGFDLSAVAGFAVDVSDSGIDNATQDPNHFALHKQGVRAMPGSSRVIYNRLEGAPNAGSTLQGCDGHGNLNTHIVAGYVPSGGPVFGVAPHMDASGYNYGVGVAPFVKVGSSVIFDPDNFTYPNYANLQSEAYNDGSRISTNSWGASVGGAYNSDSQAYDYLVRDAQPAGSTFPTAGNQEMVIVFSAGNSGSGANTIGSPGTGKNMITVGAAENVHPFGAADACGIGDTGADSANDIISFSSRGPCDDGRIKPDLQAPGTHISGGVFQAANTAPTTGATGAAGACFTASGVCEGPSGSLYWPVGQQWYTASDGTSHSCPATAGAAALVRQRFINNAMTPPSPAMTKAVLMNAARYMTGVSANDTLPSNNQGWGEVHLANTFDEIGGSTATILKDEDTVNRLFTASGQTYNMTGSVSTGAKPFRVTLAWTDAPGPTSGNAYVNDLDLEVTVGGVTYKGNVFSGASSVAGGTADPRDNVESVFLPAGVTGPFLVKVTATNIAGDGVPNVGGALDQDFALVVYNGVEVAQPVVALTGQALTAEGCVAANGVPDPGETVTYDITLTNGGSAPTANLVATLQATGGVTSPSGAQNYGALAAGGGNATRAFTFTVDPATTCGNTVTATFDLQDGATNLGTVSFSPQTGTLTTYFSESFDGVTAPALPAGWVAANASGPAPLWVTTTTSPDTAPNAAFVDNPAVVSDKSLDSPSIALPAGASPVRLSFRNSYALESTFDGGVLEISIGGGAFTDIVAAGGSFVSNGYNATISSSFSNPLGGRQAWSGTSGGYLTTVVNLPVAANGQSVVLRWRMGSDTSFGVTGWWIDSITLTSSSYACCYATPVIVKDGQSFVADSCLPSNGAPDPGEDVTVSLCVQNVGAGATTNLVGTLQAGGGVTNPGPAQTFGVVAGGPPVCRDFTFKVDNATTCGNQINATVAFQDGASSYGPFAYTFTTGTTTSSGPTTFSDAGAISIPSVGTGTPYPSTIAVSGLSGTVSKVTATLTNINHTFPDDIDILLVAPGGQSVILMSDVGGSTAAVNVTLTLDDAAAAPLPDAGPLVSGTFKPTNVGTGDTWAGPAPAGPYGATMSALNGGNPNGTWSLYVVDDASGDSGSIAGGWSLSITTDAPVCATSCGNTPPTITPVPVTVTGGAAAAIQTVATVTDAETPLASLLVAVNGALPTGVTMTAFAVDGSGNVTATVGANCTAALGANSVPLRVTDGGGLFADASETVTVLSGTPAVTATNNGPLCAGDTLQLSATTILGATYAWTGPAGFVSTQQNPTIVQASAANAGVYTVIATTTCPSAPATTTVVVKAGPSAVVSTPLTICQNASGTATVTTNAVTPKYEWFVTNHTGSGQIDGDTSGASVSYTATGGGIFALTCKITDLASGCVNYGNVDISVSPAPLPAINAPTYVQAGAAGQTASIASPNAGSTYAWTITNGTITAGQGTSSVTFTSTAGGSSTLKVVETTAAGCTTKQAQKKVMVYASGAPCTGDPNTLCLGQDRFKATVDWKNYNTGETGKGVAVNLTTDSGYFWFLASSNTELFVKVLDGTAVNNAYWVLFGALSDMEYTLRIEDTVTGNVKTYFNPAHTLASLADVAAFPETAASRVEGIATTGAEYGQLAALQYAVTQELERTVVKAARPATALSVAAAAAGCVNGPENLCVRNGRFSVTIQWKNYTTGQEGMGRAVPLSNDSGYFWFFGKDNLEIAAKILDGTGVNGKYWVFYGALTDVEFNMVVTDTATGTSKTYYNPPNVMKSIADVNAF